MKSGGASCDMMVRTTITVPGSLLAWAKETYPPVNVSALARYALFKEKKRREKVLENIDRMMREGVEDAVKECKAGSVHAGVCEEPGQDEEEVPAEGGGGGVRAGGSEEGSQGEA